MGAHETGNPRSAASFAVESLTDRLGDEVRFSAEEYVSQVGIEPTTRGLKVPCSTTELLAQALPRVYSKTNLSSTCGPPLVKEMAAPGKDHRKPLAVRRLDDLIVAYGATRLYDSLYAGFGQGLHAVSEREEGVARGGGSLCSFAGLPHGYPRGVDSAHLARSDTDRGPVLGEDYGVALDHAGDAPGEDQVSHLLRRRMRLCHDPVLRVVLDSVRCLEQNSARYILG